RGLQADAGERVEERFSLRRGVADAGAGDDAQAARLSSIDPAATLARAVGIEVAQHLGEESFGPEMGGERHQIARRAGAERHEALPEVGELRGSDAAGFLAALGMAERQQAADVL